MRSLLKPPWRILITIKIMLARLPIPYSFWKRLHLFEQGDMDIPERSYETFISHAGCAGVLDSAQFPPRLGTSDEEFHVLELGPGDSVFTAVVASVLGATKTWMIDANNFDTTTKEGIHSLLQYLKSQNHAIPEVAEDATVAQILKTVDGTYLTNGLESLKLIPDSSIDFCFSNSVLQHIAREEFEETFREIHRIMKPDGVNLHRINLDDHIGSKLNNLRISQKRWKNYFFRNSGIYTNCFRFHELLELFSKAGFSGHVPFLLKWNTIPTPQAKMVEPYCNWPEEQLLPCGFDICLKNDTTGSPIECGDVTIIIKV